VVCTALINVLLRMWILVCSFPSHYPPNSPKIIARYFPIYFLNLKDLKYLSISGEMHALNQFSFMKVLIKCLSFSWYKILYNKISLSDKNTKLLLNSFAVVVTFVHQHSCSVTCVCRKNATLIFTSMQTSCLCTSLFETKSKPCCHLLVREWDL
jgi:hypothetical protein